MIHIVIDQSLRKNQAHWNIHRQEITIPPNTHPASLAHEMAHAKRRDKAGAFEPATVNLDREIETWKLAMTTWIGHKPKAFIRKCLLTYVANCLNETEATERVDAFLGSLG